MEQLIADIQANFPITDPILIFSVVLFIILLMPLMLNKIRVPHIIGLIFAGAVIGESGLGILRRDVSFELFGAVGLLYIMFLAGLQMDLTDFKKNMNKSIFFGMATFLIPMLIGTISSYFLLELIYEHIYPHGFVAEIYGPFSMKGYIYLSAVLIASMYASHTLIPYPIVGRYGVTKETSVNVSIGGTMITTILSLMILAVIVSMTKGELGWNFWLKFVVSLVAFGFIIGFIFPRLTDRFFKHHEDNILQYIYVLAMCFLGGFIAKLAGLEPIIGAFLVGLAFNRRIPRISPLMNRLDFVGNALFIPFFLIGVGMLIDFRAVFAGPSTLITAIVMCVVATVSKYLAAVLTKHTFKMSKEEGLMMFGLSNSQAAATLAAVMIGYNIEIGRTVDGGVIRLLNEDILNGTIVMILVTCTIASFATEKAAKKLVRLQDQLEDQLSEDKLVDRILVPLYNPETLRSLMELAVLLKVDKSREPLYALTISNKNAAHLTSEDKAKKLLEKAAKIAAGTDNHVRMFNRNDANVAGGIVQTIRENHITEVVIGLHHKNSFTDSFLGDKTESLLRATNQMTFVYHAMQPVSTIKRVVVAVPPKAEFEIGFVKWYDRVKNLCKQIGAKAVFYAHTETLEKIRILAKRNKFGVETQFCVLDDWDDFLMLAGVVTSNDLFVVVSSRKTAISYDPLFEKLPSHLSKYFAKNSYIILYPDQFDENMSDGFVADTNSVVKNI